MPKVVIKEYYEDSTNTASAENFSVVVPGFVSSTANIDVFDENGIYECTSQSDFVSNIGKVKPEMTNGSTEEDKITYYHYGNQMAYKLLGLGYTVLYMKLDDITNLVDSTKWDVLKDRSMYDFRYLVSGLIDDIPQEMGYITVTDSKGAETDVYVTVKNVNEIMNDVATHINTTTDDSNGRGDCIALLDIAKSVYSASEAATQSAALEAMKDAATVTSSSAAYFAPTVIYSSTFDSGSNSYGNVEMPGSFHYLACASDAFTRYSEWYAVTGYTRGTSAYTVVGTGRKFGDAAVNALQKRSGKTGPAINLIVLLGGSYYLWGNRTAYYSSDKKNELVYAEFLNIRQLCCTINKTAYYTCRHLMFDPNDELLWLNFCNAIRPTLEDMEADRGLSAFAFNKKETSLKGKLFASIGIVPVEAVEDFEIGLILADSIEGTSVEISETLV